jgi:predicted Zn-dependent protease
VSFHVAVVPIGRLDTSELEPVLVRVARAIRQPVELREALPVPHRAEDAARGQYRAADMIKILRDEVAKLAPGRLVGAEEATAKPPLRPDAFIFVTDVDLFTAKSEGVLGAQNQALGAALVSVRRLREAFWKRRADPERQRARFVKELLRWWGRLQGLDECADPSCPLSRSRGLPDLDAKDEAYCRDCAQNLFSGKLRI